MEGETNNLEKAMIIQCPKFLVTDSLEEFNKNFISLTIIIIGDID